jgi:hypothetical protein
MQAIVEFHIEQLLFGAASMNGSIETMLDRNTTIREKSDVN